MNDLEAIKQLVADMEADAALSDKKNHSAGTRYRKKLLELGKLTKVARENVLKASKH